MFDQNRKKFLLQPYLNEYEWGTYNKPRNFSSPEGQQNNKRKLENIKGKKKCTKKVLFLILLWSSTIFSNFDSHQKVFKNLHMHAFERFELLQNWWKSIKKVFVSTCMLSILNVVLVHLFWKVKWCAVPLILFHWLFYRFSGQFSCMFLNNSQHQQNNVLFCTSQCNYISEWSACSQHVVGYFGPHIPLASYLPDNR